MRVVVGIDPGLASTGFGIVGEQGGRFRHLGHEVFRSSSSDSTGERLHAIHRGLMRVVERYRPSEAAVETLYFARNVSSALPVAQARGVMLLALEQAGVQAHEYSPQAIKLAIVGRGRAEKEQVQELVRVLLGLEQMPSSDHAADALAVAICHLQSSAGLRRIQAGLAGSS